MRNVKEFRIANVRNHRVPDRIRAMHSALRSPGRTIDTTLQLPMDVNEDAVLQGVLIAVAGFVEGVVVIRAEAR